MQFKTLTELAEIEIYELEHAVKNESDMEDYISQFAEHTALQILHIMKSLLKENNAHKAKQQPITIKRRIAV